MLSFSTLLEAAKSQDVVSAEELVKVLNRKWCEKSYAKIDEEIRKEDRGTLFNFLWKSLSTATVSLEILKWMLSYVVQEVPEQLLEKAIDFVAFLKDNKTAVRTLV